MKNMQSLAVCALIAPAIMVGAASTFAQEPSVTADGAQEQQQRAMPGQAQQEEGMAAVERAREQRMAAERAQMKANAREVYLSSPPANAFRADELIGSDLQSRPDSETIGAISNLLIDDNGQIVAVIVEVGGFLGLGEKEVAISWDSVERSPNEKGDGHDFTVSATKDALTNAPEFMQEEASEY